jgi:hypothetical protein
MDPYYESPDRRSPETNSYPNKNSGSNNRGSIFATIIGACLLLFLISVSTAERWTVVDVPEHLETFHEEERVTDEYDVFDTGEPICEGNGRDDYLTCVNMHVTMYNSICAKKKLSFSAKATCDGLDEFIDGAKAKYQSCRYGCTTGVTADGKWGWNYYSSELSTTTELEGNNDYTPAKTHQATCYLGFIGECKKK